jgi:hypothetical protein
MDNLDNEYYELMIIMPYDINLITSILPPHFNT